MKELSREEAKNVFEYYRNNEQMTTDELLNALGYPPSPVNEVKLSERVRPDCEVSRWVYDAIIKQEIAFEKRIKELEEEIYNNMPWEALKKYE